MKYNIPHYLILFGFILCTGHSFAQNRIVDSLVKDLNNTKTDTGRLRVYRVLCDGCNMADNLKYGIPFVELADETLTQTYDKKVRKWIFVQKAHALSTVTSYYMSKRNTIKALEYLDEELIKLQEKGNKDEIGNMFICIGNFYDNEGSLSKGLEYNFKAFSIFQQLKDSNTMAFCLRIISSTYNDQSNYEKALEYDLKALELAEKSGDSYQNMAIYNRLVAEQYNKLGDSLKSDEYEIRALRLEEQNQDKSGIADVLLGIGDLSIDRHNYSRGLEYVQKSLAQWSELRNKNRIAYSLGRIAKIYREVHNYSTAIQYYFKALEMYRENHDHWQVSYSYLRIGQMYTYQLKNYKLARIYLQAFLDTTIELADNAFRLDYMTEAYKSLADLDSLTANYKAEISDYKKCIFYRDSVNNIRTSQQTLQVEMNYEFNAKSDSVKAMQDQKDIRALADKHRQRIITASVLGGLFLVLFFTGFVFRSLRITRRQNQVIETKNKETEAQKRVVEERNKIIEEKNKDILDSITYAKRLQDAILPPLTIINQYLPESFVLYKPKDIVAGDFYWMEKSGDNILIAAADCTGHGVPGALVSVVCSNALDRAVKEFHITEIGKILDKTRELVLATFEKSGNNVQDGMDISLCGINTKTNEVEWSGAYNSLWFVHNGVMNEVEADKQPIGKTNNPKPFNTYKLNLKKGDTLYLYTDGFADQFGGPKGKKFKYKQLESVLLANSTKPMDEQKRTLETILTDWKGNLEQVDDILVIGIKV